MLLTESCVVIETSTACGDCTSADNTYDAVREESG